MARRVLPELPEPKFKKRSRVTTTEANLTRTEIDVVPDDPTRPTREGSVNEFLAQALRRCMMAADAEVYNRAQGLIDSLMVDGDGQWDDTIKGRRMRKKRPCLTINRFKPMIAHVANEQRMSRPAIQIDPVGGGADPKSAEIRQGLIRHIEVMSSAETVYDTAFERMIEKGWSWFRVVTDWESPLSHNQVVKIEGFTNDFCIYADPTAEDPTRKDMKWAFVVYDMPRGEYMTQHPKSKACGFTAFASIGDTAPGWLTPESIRVVEYYYLEEEPANSVRLIGGDGVWEDEIEERDGLWYKTAELAAMDAGEMQPEQVQPIPADLSEGKLITRKSFKPKPKWAKINALEILDGDKGDDIEANTKGREIPGKYIPLVMVSGRERMVNGQRRLEGMVRANRDAQRMYNYMASGFAEMVALAPKAPFIAAMGQIEEFKALWDSLNEENYGWLPYKEKTAGNNLVPPPQRQDNRIAENAAGYIQGLQLFDNMLKAGFNIFDPSLGQAKSDQSGRAIAGLQARSDSANMNWMDNMRRAQIYCGEIILEMIPVVYDSARIVTIVRAKGTREEVQINQEFGDANGTIKVLNDMSTGKYAVTVSLGQYASKRQQAVQSLTEIAKNVPAVSLALLPLILMQMDTPMAEEAAAIIKRMQPPDLQEPGSPEAMKAQLDQLMKQHGLLVQALERANEIIKMKQIESSDKRYVVDRQTDAQVATVGAKLGSIEGMKSLELEWQQITDLINRHHEKVMQASQQGHEVGLEAMKAENEPEPAGATA